MKIIKLKINQILSAFFLTLLIVGGVTISDLIFAEEKSYSIGKAIAPSMGSVNPEYTKWSNLTEEEQKNTIEPPMYIIKDNSYTLNTKKIKTFDVQESDVIPSTYDSRNVSGNNYVTSIKNQQDTPWCGIFSANANLESFLKKKYNATYDFSERYHRYATIRDFLNNEKNIYGFNESPNNGTNYQKVGGFFSSGRGPILETDMPFVNNTNLINISETQNKNTTVHVKNIKFYPSYLEKKDSVILEIKKHIMDYGSINISYRSHETDSYNSSTGAIYYNGENTTTNHGVLIIGWDDNYSKTNFNTNNRPVNDGAWIIKNSWGTGWGNSGYGYISYDEKLVYKYPYGIMDVSNEKDFDNAYFYDPLGWVNNWGYDNNNPVYVANKYTKKSNNKEVLTEVTIGTLGVTNYKLYINNVNSELISTNVKLIQSGVLEYAGYHTIVLDNPIILDGSNFSLIAEYQVPGETNPVPMQISYNYENWEDYQYDGYEANQSFISQDKDSWWYDLYDGKTKTAPSIKAFTQNIDYDFNIGTITKSSSTMYGKVGEKITVPITSSNISATPPYDIKIIKTSSISNTDVTNKFSITGNSISNNSSSLKLEVLNQLENGNYRVEITHEYVTKTFTFEVEKYVSITGMTLSTNSTTINKGDILNVTATIDPINATNKSLNWISNNTSIATVNSSGRVTAIAEGNTTITVSTTDGSNISKTITLTVTDYQYTTSYLIDGDYLKNITKKTTYQNFLNNFTTSSGITLQVKKSDNSLVSSGYIGSGMKIEIYDNTSLIKTYYVVLKGDIDGDGDITAGDAYDIIFHSIGKRTLNSRLFKSADIDGDNNINAADAYDIVLYSIGKKNNL